MANKPTPHKKDLPPSKLDFENLVSALKTATVKIGDASLNIVKGVSSFTVKPAARAATKMAKDVKSQVDVSGLISTLVMKINPFVGKSGPLTNFINSATSKFGLSTKEIVASQTSFKLWGGIFVAIPTAIPEEPLISKFGNFPGNTEGSFREPSKLFTKSTVFLSISEINSSDIFANLHST